MSRTLWAMAPFMLLVACAPEIPEDERPSPNRVSAVFDADTATIPLPSSAVLDRDGTLPNRGGEGAQGEFNSWLGRASGWDPTAPISLPFSGELRESSISSETVRFFEVSAAGELNALAATLEYVVNDSDSPVCSPTVCGSLIRVIPEVPLSTRKRYAVVATRGLRGGDGLNVLPSSAMFFAASTEPLVDGNGQSVVSSVDSGTAARLEGLRRLLRPIIEELGTEGIGGDDLVSATVWGTSENPFSVLDPASATLPIPNTLALDSDQTFPRNALDFCGPTDSATACSGDGGCTGLGQICVRGTCTATRCAQGTFDRYLDGLHGWPPTTPVTLPVTAEIDPESLTASSVQLWRFAVDGLQRVEATPTYDVETGLITLNLAAPMGLNAQYVAFATRGVQGTNGLPLLPPPAVAMTVQPHPVVDSEGKSLVAEIPDADAARIEAIRQFLRPVAEAVQGRAGTKYQDLAAIWVWSTWTDSFVAFDPSQAVLAFPNAFLTAGCPSDRPVCALYNPDSPPENPLQAQLFDELSQRSGFSTTATNWIPTEGSPLVAETVSSENVLFAEVQAVPSPLEVEEYEVRLEFDHILIDFNRPLLPETLVAGIATNGMMGTNGFPAQPSPAFVFLRSEFPLVDGDGGSLVSTLDDGTAQLLEQARLQYRDLWLAANILGYAREDVVSAWAYTTQETYKPLQRLRAQAIAKLPEASSLNGYRACEPDCVDDPALEGPLPENYTIPHPEDPTVDVDLSNVEWIQWKGEFESVSFFDAMRRPLTYHEAAGNRVGVSVFVPRSENCSAPFDVAIAQHGNGGWRYQMAVAMANDLAGKCIATVAMDLPLHGGRSPSATSLHPDERPADSGEGFVGLDLVGTKGSFLQSAIDLVVLAQHIRAGALDDMVGVQVSDETSQISYVGISMGGFVGALFSAVDPHVGPTVLNVAGGNFGLLLRESEVFSTLLEGAVEFGTFEYLQTLHFIQWLGEHADPYVFARHLTRDPIQELVYDPVEDEYSNAGVLPTKEVLVQMAVDDPTVPNSSTVLLAGELGIDLGPTTFENASHAFLITAAPSAEQACAREQIAEWFRSGFDGVAELPASLHAQSCSGGL